MLVRDMNRILVLWLSRQGRSVVALLTLANDDEAAKTRHIPRDEGIRALDPLSIDGDRPGRNEVPSFTFGACQADTRQEFDDRKVFGLLSPKDGPGHRPARLIEVGFG